jgi:hypothetical protein
MLGILLRNLIGGEKNEQPHDDCRDIFVFIQTIREGWGLALRESQAESDGTRGGQVRKIVCRLGHQYKATRIGSHDKIQTEQEEIDRNE